MTKIGYSILDSISAVIGFNEAIALSAAYGDTKLNVPNEMTDDHRIAQLIGIDAARVFVEHYKGMELRIPKLDYFERVKNAAHVYDLHERHKLPAFAICNMLGVKYGVVKDALKMCEKIKPTRRFPLAKINVDCKDE